jgi:hypothetical protein
MKWFIVGYLIFTSGGDPGIIQGYTAPTRQYQIEMPSEEVCKQILEMNKFMNLECWAKSNVK